MSETNGNERAGKYQMLAPLRPEERKSLEADIKKRGVLVPVERDEEGEILDGHNRQEIASALGLDCPAVVRHFATEQEKREHVIKINLARRHLDPLRWGQAFALLLRERGIRTGRGGDRKSTDTLSVDTVADVAEEVGVNERTARRRLRAAEAYDAILPGVKEAIKGTPVEEKVPELLKLAKLEPERQRAVAEKIAAGKAKVVRQAQNLVDGEAIRAEPPPLPEGPFRVIAADPPWAYDNRPDDAAHRAGNPYPSMTVGEIKKYLPPTLAHEDCVLWLWTTNAHMREAFEVVEAWGFEHKTILTWAKDRMGTGDWLRGQTEHCLLAVRGKPTLTLTNQTTLIGGPLREHSRKPDTFYELVESLCPAPERGRVELFQREPREGWVGHGNDTKRFGG